MNITFLNLLEKETEEISQEYGNSIYGGQEEKMPASKLCSEEDFAAGWQSALTSVKATLMAAGAVTFFRPLFEFSFIFFGMNVSITILKEDKEGEAKIKKYVDPYGV
jgi:hypothetical protein